MSFRTSRRTGWAVLAGLGLGLLALGPGIRPGFLLSYDMVFVPRPAFNTAIFGGGGTAPRAVPSDVVVALLDRVLPADLVQKLVLLAIFALACAGVAALVEHAPLAARLAAGVCYVWNPFVAERLLLGQWALLLGYAGLPWVARAVTRSGSDSRRFAGRLALALLPAAIGGFAALCVSVPVAVAGAALGAGSGWRQRAGRTAVSLGLLAMASLPWLVPALAHPVDASPAGVAAFAARADTPFGSAGSLLMLGGGWNSQTVPSGYGGALSVIWLAFVVVAIGGFAILGRARWPGLGVAAATGLAVACLGISNPGQAVLRTMIRHWAGFAVLRDGQQFIAALALAEAVGVGLAVAWLLTPAGHPTAGLVATAGASDAGAGTEPDLQARLGPGPEARLEASHLELSRGGRREAGLRCRRERSRGGRRGPYPGREPVMHDVRRLVAFAALILPVIALPGLVWGAAGRLQPVQFPGDWQVTRTLLGGHPDGKVVLLPWAAYRRYPWNGGRAVLDPWPRLLAATVIWNDAVQVGGQLVPSENPAVRALSPLLDAGGPLTGSLRAAGVRYVIVDAGFGAMPGRLPFAARLPGASVLISGPGIVVYRL